jgi:hypothetical protein
MKVNYGENNNTWLIYFFYCSVLPHRGNVSVEQPSVLYPTPSGSRIFGETCRIATPCR